MKNFEDPRHSTRLIVLQELFLEDFTNSQNTSSESFSVDDYLLIDELESYDKDLHKKLLNGVRDRIDEIDSIVVKFAPQWPISQIKKVDLQILRIAIYEGFLTNITPPKVAIDEAIELAKEFGGQASDKFVNGVLGALYEEYKISKKK